MNLVRYNPFDMAFDRLFDDLWSNAPRMHWEREGAEHPTFVPRVDIRDLKDSVVLTAELPGIDKDNLSVTVENGLLTISGEKREEAQSEETGFYRTERAYGSFKRSFRLPEVVDPERISAEYVHGLLRLTLPKRPEAAPKHIEIKAGEGEVKEIGVN